MKIISIDQLGQALRNYPAKQVYNETGVSIRQIYGLRNKHKEFLNPSFEKYMKLMEFLDKNKK